MAAINSVDLSTYTLIGRYDLPEPTRTTPPTNSLLAQEVSAVTYNPDTDTLFVVGDGGTSVVQITKTGQLIDSMTLAPGSSPQGTDFYDPEGLTYVGNGKFVLIEERDRQANLFTYVPNTTLTKSNVQTVKLGATVGNIGIEGISYDPQTGGFIAVKEESPQGIFQTNIDFVAGTATNGSPTTVNSENLFDPAKANLLDFADVYALSNIPALNGQTDSSHILVLSQASGQIVEVDRAGNIYSSLTIGSNPGNPLSVPDQQHEGLTMDKDGILYVTSENGGGDINHPQLWVYAPSAVANQAPTALALNNRVTAIAENTSTATRLKVADLAITDDGIGTNALTVTGADASFFEVDSNGLYIKAGTVLDYETKTSYSVSVNVDDTTVGNTPDATATYTLAVTDVVNEVTTAPSLIISEVAPWSSGNSSYAADWFEITNTGTSAVDITGWKIDDNSNAFASAVALNGITSIAAGQSVVFIESATPATTIAAFQTAWFGSNVPSNFKIGTYTGSGVGLSTGGDAVNLFDASGNRITGINFGASTSYFSFDNTSGLGGTTLPLPVVSTLSAVGVNAFQSVNNAPIGTTKETGSPGTVNKAPTAVVLNNPVNAIAENTSTATRIKVADIAITDDGIGTNVLSLSGTDANFFEVDNTGLYVKAGTALDYETKDRYNVTVNVDDTIVGSNPDATTAFSLAAKNVNDLASISGTATGNVKEGTNVATNGKLTISGTLTVTDQDAGENKFKTTITSANGNLGSLTITETGAYTYTVDNSAVQYLGAGQTKVETFTVTSLDGTASQTIAITINGVTAAYSGVAAGDATSNSAILWTRTYDGVNPIAQPGITENVTLQLSTDSGFATIAQSINGVTRDANHDYTLKIDATGLQSGTKYYYRFQSAGGELSSVGTFKTAPDATTQTAVRFGFSGDADGLMRPYTSTQNFPNLNLDYFVFLGDTIYETASTGSPAAANPVTNPNQALIDYHRKYLENIQPVQPGGFASLETMFTSQGNYTVLDNHELGNKQLINGGASSALVTLSGNGSSNPTDDVNTTGTFINDTVGFKTLEQAYLDYQPVREKIISAPSDPRTDGTQQLYFAQQWGQNVVYVNTDTRSYRDVRLKTAAGADDTGARADNPDRTLLGDTQLAWVKQTLLDAQNNGTAWKFVTVSDPIDQIGAIGSGADGGKSWIGGYRAERNELLKFIADNGIKNVVFLSTDDHQSRINELTYTDNGVVKLLPNAISVVDGPIGATGPDTVTNHSFSNIKSLADTLATAQTTAGVNPIGLASDFYGLKNVVREGDPNADTLRQPVDFYSPDTFNYTVFDISPDGKTLNVNVQGINSYAQNSFPEPNSSNPVRSILSFSLDAAKAPTDLALSTTNVNENVAANTVVGAFTTTDPNSSDTFTYSLVNGTGGADNAAFAISGNQLQIKASPDFEAKTTYNILVRTTDSTGLSVDKALTITINNVNEAPTANNDSGFTANQSVAKLIPVSTLLANDTDPDANTTLTIQSNGFSNVIGGSVALVGSNVVFTPNPTFSGAASFKYTVSDGSLTSSAIVNLTVGKTVTGSNRDDTLMGNDGDDNFNGGNGEDKLYGYGGNDTLLGGSSEDSLWGGVGNDSLDGGNGEDKLYGDSGNDTLLGGNSNDILWGGDGDDWFNGGGGEDKLTGGSGRDIFVVSRTGNGKDTILDFTLGQDQIGLSGGLSFGQLTFTNLNGSAAIRFGNETLELLPGVIASQLTASSFITV